MSTICLAVALCALHLGMPGASFILQSGSSWSKPSFGNWQRKGTTSRVASDKAAETWLPDPEIAGGALVGTTFRLQAAVAVLEGLRVRTSTEWPLNLLEHTFDAATGLVSPGVWHNAITGYAALKVARNLELTARDTTDPIIQGECAALGGKYRAWARDIGVSLHEHSFVANQGFQKRPSGAAGGAWALVSDSAVMQQLLDAGEDPNFYKPSTARHGGANAMAVLFYSLLAEELPDDPEVAALAQDTGQVFLRQFFDPSCGRFRSIAVGDQALNQPEEWRAVDQAVGTLACVRIAKAMGKRKGFEARAMATSGAQSLLEQFGYGRCAEGEGGHGVRNHFPPRSSSRSNNNDIEVLLPDRNSWADGWACLAIAATEACSGRESTRVLVKSMEIDYSMDYSDEAGSTRQVIAHAPRSRRLAKDAPEEAQTEWFTSSQAIWAAILQSDGVQDSPSKVTSKQDAKLSQLFATSAVQSGPFGKLLPVGGSKEMAAPRLWANTEFAALLLFDPLDFRL